MHAILRIFENTIQVDKRDALAVVGRKGHKRNVFYAFKNRNNFITPKIVLHSNFLIFMNTKTRL